MKIFIIDDSKDTIDRFKESSPSDVEIQSLTCASRLDDKYERRINEFGPDLIILDLLLSQTVESGFRVLRQLKASYLLKNIPVVVWSMYIGEACQLKRNKERALRLGAVAATSKCPFPKWDQILEYAKPEGGYV